MNQLKKLLSSVQYSNVDQINIRSSKLQIIINTKKQSNINIKKISTQQLITRDNYNDPKIQKNSIKTDTKQENKTNESNTYSTIVSPMVGTFYRSPAPNEPAFIEKNDIVQKKQIVCIIEAMKLMNEIESELDGEVVEILVKDGDIVDCGQALIKIKSI